MLTVARQYGTGDPLVSVFSSSFFYILRKFFILKRDFPFNFKLLTILIPKHTHICARACAHNIFPSLIQPYSFSLSLSISLFMSFSSIFTLLISLFYSFSLQTCMKTPHQMFQGENKIKLLLLQSIADVKLKTLYAMHYIIYYVLLCITFSFALYVYIYFCLGNMHRIAINEEDNFPHTCRTRNSTYLLYLFRSSVLSLMYFLFLENLLLTKYPNIL